MNRIIMYPHGGSGNHGCEAIVRATVKMLEGDEIYLFSENPKEDEKYLFDLPLIIQYPRKKINKKSIAYINNKIKQVVFRQNNIFDIDVFSPILDLCDNKTILLSIGGDNYCYGDNDYIFLVNNEARKKGTKTVLWGASVDQSLVSEKMISDLSHYSLIVARESISYKFLKTINPNTVFMPDPAFFLPKEETVIPQETNIKNTVGINISPLILNYANNKEILQTNIECLIDYILYKTDFNIVLIPHVVWQTNDDRIVLKSFLEKYNSFERVFLVEDQNCMKLKYIISKCNFFVGARTHATIAAYSSGIPTIVLGYSVKSIGIAQDIFGNTKNYVLPVQEITSEQELTEMFMNLMNNEKTIKQQLIYYQENNKENVDKTLVKLKNIFYE